MSGGAKRATILSVFCFVVASCANPDAPSSAVSNEPSQSRQSSYEPSHSSLAPSTAPSAISREVAIELAHEALRESGEDWSLVRALRGELMAVRPGWEETSWGRDLSGELVVWWLQLRSGDLSAEVVLNAVDGTLLGSVSGIAD